MSRSTRRWIRILALTVAVCTVAGGVVVLTNRSHRNHVVAYFQNTNGIYVGDDVRVLGVRVGGIDSIEPQPQGAKVSFWYDATTKIPADARAVILSPSLVTSRAIQLTPAYTGGATLNNDAVIPQDRTAVPVEWDDFREQLQKITEALAPTTPGGLSTLGSLVSTAADNLRVQGPDLRSALVELSDTFSAIGDHSNDLFGTVRNLAKFVTALQTVETQMRQLNGNLASVTGLLADDPDEIGNAVSDLSNAAREVTGFIENTRESLGTTADRLSSISSMLVGSLDDVKQALHIGPSTFANFVNIYQPAQGALTGMLAVPNLGNPISFICGAIQAASRLGAEESAKLCVQYLAPIVKNRQINFLPLGVNPFVGTQTRPNEVTYSEDWLRPDYVPPPAKAPAPPAVAPAALPAEAQPTDPAAGLPGLMLPPGR